MAIYEFFCDDCRDLFEERRKMAAADDPAPCPTCGREARRVISLVNAITGSTGHDRPVAGAGHGCGCSAAGCSCGAHR